jgi:hypothetical protein
MGGRGGYGKENNVRFPKGESQLKHIFAKRNGHVDDTAENRRLLIDTAANEANCVETKPNGNRWYAKGLENGTQVWIEVRNGIIQNGGINNPPVIDWAARGITNE